MLVAESCLTLLWPHWTLPTRLLCPWDFPGKNTAVGCHFLLQGTFPTQGSNLRLFRLLLWQASSLPLSHRGSSLMGIYVVNLSSYSVTCLWLLIVSFNDQKLLLLRCNLSVFYVWSFRVSHLRTLRLAVFVQALSYPLCGPYRPCLSHAHLCCVSVSYWV